MRKKTRGPKNPHKKSPPPKDRAKRGKINEKKQRKPKTKKK
jgi:hypothetical protein